MADSRLITVERGRRVTFTLDGDEIAAYEGETVAAALVAADRWQIRRSTRLALPRGIYCNMGVCYDCLVIHQGRSVRSCMLQVEDGMVLTSFGPKAVP
jgi:predicted molibdopterin-dependent oxidoreductase YjgC